MADGRLKALWTMSARRITFFVVPIRELGIHQPNPGAIEIKADAVVANIIVRVEDVEKVVPPALQQRKPISTQSSHVHVAHKR